MTNYDTFLSTTGRHLHESAIRKMGTLAVRIPDLVSFAAGFPDPVTFPWDDLREITSELLGGGDGTVLQYGATRGYRPLLEALVEIVAGRHIDSTPLEQIVTTGSQQGLDLVARVLVDPGDVVLVELPTYTGAISAFTNVQARLVGVRQEADGIDLQDLDAVCQRERAAGRRVNLLYLVPNFQNPTGLLIGLDKRRRLLEWAERRNLLIVEDDPYGVLYFDDVASEAGTRPIKADDAHGRVIYLSTFSKTLAPGFRMAWVTAPEALIARFDLAKQSMDLSSGIFDQRVVHLAIRRGVLQALAPRLRALYRDKRDAMVSALRGELGGHLTWPEPKGGFFLWVELPESVDGDALLQRAIDERVIFVAGSAFYVDGTGQNRIRLSFSHPTAERLKEGARRLAAALKPALITLGS
ncbi:MAG: PLP-dependent aminotransferase family protein [Vicinamibacterales bacterium]